jgi:hypothetical protein
MLRRRKLSIVREEGVMKVFAVYDQAGRIIGVVTPREGVEDGAFELIAEPGHHVSEIT